MKKMNISNLSKKYFSYLSDGEKKISLIARALIKKPEILILDEPLANLDYKSKFFVFDKINELSKLKNHLDKINICSLCIYSNNRHTILSGKSLKIDSNFV